MAIICDCGVNSLTCRGSRLYCYALGPQPLRVMEQSTRNAAASASSSSESAPGGTCPSSRQARQSVKAASSVSTSWQSVPPSSGNGDQQNGSNVLPVFISVALGPYPLHVR